MELTTPTFPTDLTGLPEAARAGLLELADGDDLHPPGLLARP